MERGKWLKIGLKDISAIYKVKSNWDNIWERERERDGCHRVFKFVSNSDEYLLLYLRDYPP